MMHRPLFHGKNLLQGPHRGLGCVEMRIINIFVLDGTLRWMSCGSLIITISTAFLIMLYRHMATCFNH